MDTESWIAAIILAITFAMISVRRLPGIRISMWGAAMAGAILMLASGVVDLDSVPGYLNFDVILLLLGMMLLVAALDSCGFFGRVTNLMLKGSGDGRGLLAFVMLIAAFLSALVLNDAVVLLMTPVVIRVCRRIDAKPIPYLVGTFIAANVGSTATVIGNPQNAYIATSAGIDFLTFSRYLAPLAIICLIASYAIMVIAFRGSLRIPNPLPGTERMESDPRLPPVILIAIAMMIMFALSHPLGIDLWVIAMAGGSLACLASAIGEPSAVKAIVKRVDWSVLLFFIGLFVVMAGVVESGLLEEIMSLIPGFSDGSPSVEGLTIITTIISNLISNVPCVILLSGMIPAGDLQLWLTMAAVSTLAGNMTMIGAAANVIVSEEAEREGILIDFWRFLMVGIPVSLITLAIAAVYMNLAI